MATFEESFLYPLILLLIGAGITIGVSSLLIPWFAKKSENRKKELEIKVDIVSKMAEIIGSACGSVLLLIRSGKAISTPDEKDAAYKDREKLFADGYKIQELLKSYSSEESIIDGWVAYYLVLVALKYASSLYFHKQPNEEEKKKLEDPLEEINEYFSDNKLVHFPDNIKVKWERLTTDKTFHPDLWERVTSTCGREGDRIMETFLYSRIKIF